MVMFHVEQPIIFAAHPNPAQIVTNGSLPYGNVRTPHHLSTTLPSCNVARTTHTIAALSYTQSYPQHYNMVIISTNKFGQSADVKHLTLQYGNKGAIITIW
jgi:hypothetical protein